MKKILLVTLMMLAGIAHAADPSCIKVMTQIGTELVTFHKLRTSRIVVANRFKFNTQVQDTSLAIYDSMNRNEPVGGYTQREYDRTIQSIIRGACY